jgi:hypothetical protein
MLYERDDALVDKAAKLLEQSQDEAALHEARRLLLESEQSIDEHSSTQFGMRFMGITELKTSGGQFAGLFYNDHVMVLVFKGTSVLSFSKYFFLLPLLGYCNNL